jgi:Tfp pilus assembly protein PilX
MKTMKRDSKTSKRGLVLPLIAAIALCLAILGIGVLQLGFGSRLMATRTMAGVSARAAADAGITRALYEMNQHFIVGQGWDHTLPSGNVDLGNSNATCSYTVQGPFLEMVEPYWLIT